MEAELLLQWWSVWFWSCCPFKDPEGFLKWEISTSRRAVVPTESVKGRWRGAGHKGVLSHDPSQGPACSKWFTNISWKAELPIPVFPSGRGSTWPFPYTFSDLKSLKSWFIQVEGMKTGACRRWGDFRCPPSTPHSALQARMVGGGKYCPPTLSFFTYFFFLVGTGLRFSVDLW